MLIFSKQPLDDSRRMDMEKLRLRSSDFTRPEKERKVAEEAMKMIEYQNKYVSIRQMREKLRIATLNGDKDKMEKISKESLRIDKDFKL